jgi:hypothetical protein
VPAGYVLVPVEPTPEMLTASYVFAHIDNTADSWKAMLAAAPKAPDGWIPVSDGAEPPREGWLLTHKGRDYFYRNQADAVAHMDTAVDTNDLPLSIRHMEHKDGVPSNTWIPVSERMPDYRLQKAIVDACIVFLHGCDGLSKNYECDFW